MSELGQIRPAKLEEPRKGETLPFEMTVPLPIITLIPNSTIQFLDLKLKAETATNVRRRYFEDYGRDDADDAAALHAVTLEDGVFIHPVTQLVGDANQTYVVDGEKAVEAFLDTWLPLPLLRVIDHDATTHALLDEGPTNWARIFVSRYCSDENAFEGFRIVLALDTTLDVTTANGSDTSPRYDDAVNDRVFQFSSDENDIGAFVTEAWIDDWLAEAYQAYHKRVRPPAEEAWQHVRPLEHLANYLTLLAVLDHAGILPTIRFQASEATDHLSAPEIGVDLVLDIGSCRTMAFLAEGAPDVGTAETGSAKPAALSPLPIRNLTTPWRASCGVVPSQVQFAKPDFGKEALSRWSGRANAFYWPSLVRIGEEAAELGSRQDANGDQTGVSSPMHYLWDEEPTENVWRFASPTQAGSGRTSLVSGPLLALLTEAGTPVRPGERGGSTTKPRFSRSSLVTFAVSELILHALTAMNSPDYRLARGKAEIARRLARLVISVPGTLHPREQHILRNRLENAIYLVWQSLKWSHKSVAPTRPEVVLVSGNPGNIEVAYVYNEIVHKFAGEPRAYLDLVGKMRPHQRTGHSLCISTLDIGGNSTGISVSTWELGETGQVIRTPQLSDGLPIGGDDIRKAIVEQHVVPALAQGLAEAGLRNPRRFLEEITGSVPSTRRPWLAEFAGRFVADLLAPVATALLSEHAASPNMPDDVPCERTIKSLLESTGVDAQAVADVLDELAADEGAEGFSPLSVSIVFLHRELATTIRQVISPLLTNALRVVQAFDCDVVLLSGWAARLPATIDTLLQGMPTRPNRIVAMHDYRVGEWYPLRDGAGRVGDTKALAALGAYITSLSGHSGGFAFSSRPLETEPTRLFIGPLREDGLIPNDAVFFAIEPMLSRQDDLETRTATVALELPALIGMRQLSIETWPARPIYKLDWAQPGSARQKVFLKVTFERVPTAHGLPDDLRVARACDALGNPVLPSELKFTMQTLPSARGHWLDTGAISVAEAGKFGE